MNEQALVLLLFVLVSFCYMYLVIYRKDGASKDYSFVILGNRTVHRKAE